MIWRLSVSTWVICLSIVWGLRIDIWGWESLQPAQRDETNAMATTMTLENWPDSTCNLESAFQTGYLFSTAYTCWPHINQNMFSTPRFCAIFWGEADSGRESVRNARRWSENSQTCYCCCYDYDRHHYHYDYYHHCTWTILRFQLDPDINYS